RDAPPVHHGGGHDDGPAALEPRALAQRGGGAVAQRGRLDGGAAAQARLVAALERAVGEQALRRELAGDAEAEEGAAGHGPSVAVEAVALEAARGIVLHVADAAGLAGAVRAH